MKRAIMILALVMIITAVAFSSGCIGSNSSQQTRTVSVTKTLVKTNTLVKHEVTTVTTTYVSNVFIKTTVYSVTTVTVPVVTTVYVSGSVTITSTSEILPTITSTFFANVDRVIIVTNSGTIFVTLPSEAEVFSPELEVIKMNTTPAAMFDFDNYLYAVQMLYPYTIVPMGTPIVIKNTMALEYFGGNAVLRNALRFGRATLVKVYASNRPVDEFVFVNGIYYGTDMTYHPLQFSAVMKSLYGTPTLYYLAVDGQRLPVNFVIATPTAGKVYSISYSTITGSIASTTINFTNGTFFVTFETLVTTSDKLTTTTTTITLDSEHARSIFILYPFVASKVDFYVIGNQPAYGFVSVGSYEAAAYTLIHAGGSAYNYYVTLVIYPNTTITQSGIVILS